MVGSAGVLRHVPAGHRGREGRRGQNHGDRSARGRSSQVWPACARGGSRGQERPRPAVRPRRARLRRGHGARGRRVRVRAGPGDHAHRRAARVPRRPRHATPFEPSRTGRRPRRRGDRRSRDRRHPRAREGEAARAGWRRRPDPARCARGGPRHHVPRVGPRPARRGHRRAHQHPGARRDGDADRSGTLLRCCSSLCPRRRR